MYYCAGMRSLNDGSSPVQVKGCWSASPGRLSAVQRSALSGYPPGNPRNSSSWLAELQRGFPNNLKTCEDTTMHLWFWAKVLKIGLNGPILTRMYQLSCDYDARMYSYMTKSQCDFRNGTET